MNDNNQYPNRADNPAHPTDDEIPYPLVWQGKIRSLYAIDDQHLLCVASDKISAYDHVLTPEIPGKGAILTATTVFFLNQLNILHHLVPHRDDPTLSPLTDPRIPAHLAGRAMVVRRLEMIPIECVARGYLTGSALAEYQKTSTVCGIELPAGLVEASQLPEPIFTPARKAEFGAHDENITFTQLSELVGSNCAQTLRELTLTIYRAGAKFAHSRGLILADTKLEFGMIPIAHADNINIINTLTHNTENLVTINYVGDTRIIVLGDEVLTPDSSRYWKRASYTIGTAQESLDKQILRDWLRNSSGWDIFGTDPPPHLPPQIVRQVQETYQEFYQRLVTKLHINIEQ